MAKAWVNCSQRSKKRAVTSPPSILSRATCDSATLDQLACNGAPLLHVSANFERYPCCIETPRYHDVRASSPNMSKRTTQASWWRKPLKNIPGKHIGWCISIERAEKSSINHGSNTLATSLARLEACALIRACSGAPALTRLPKEPLHLTISAANKSFFVIWMNTISHLPRYNDTHYVRRIVQYGR